MAATLTRPPPVVVAPPPASPTDPVQALRNGLVKFTADDAARMVELAVLSEDSTVELLGGLLVHRDCGSSKGDPAAAGIEHDYVVRMIGKLDRHIDADDRHLVTQLTLRLDADDSPIPDAMILRGPTTAYRGRQPEPRDVLCLIEVADSSYARDAGEKRFAYARAGVPQYVIVDLRNRSAEVYADPDSAAGSSPSPQIVQGDGGRLPLRVGEDESFAVDLASLLP
jgi:hypothetical protein